VRKKYQRKLKAFEERCSLIGYLGKVMKKKYLDPEDRPLDFDHKLGSFLHLEVAR
jgi:adenylate/nucleoside-diphosphate kinase